MKKVMQNKGFTLIETLVAVTVLATSVASAMAITNKSLQASMQARDQTIAVFLAAEGVELVHNIRDNVAGEILASTDPNWSQWLGTLGSCDSGCDVNPINLNILSCTNDDGCQLNMVDGIYTSESGGTATKFYRKIFVNGSGDEAVVTSTVTWGNNDYSVSENIMNWHKVSTP